MNLLEIFAQVGEGMGNSILIFVLTLVFSLPLGLLVAFGRMNRWAPLAGLKKSKSPFWRKAAEFRPVQLLLKLFISILRGTPLMLQLLAVTYGPYYLFELPVSRNKLIPVVIAFAINYAAYFAEIYRGGIESMPVGQYEAAEVLGYTKTQTFIHVILPQVFKRIMPSITNEVVTLVKDTSMAFTVSYQEMFTIGKQIANSETSFVPFLVAGVFYFVFNAVVDFVMGRVEKRMSYYQ